ncbi:hypothetical protein [Jeotgalibacillus salarius]|uniref:Uncharacterized protein n=1 Tax=Jeotgalibacillus salarius TaxID=546023 RepID=A0A4Y8LHG2_9BACL|nr:hypothetical protein [Jeotgalibacillus salarius]TFE02164.1 hypothetical protein E2626_06195 [Jeotgalibacillus salarius]
MLKQGWKLILLVISIFFFFLAAVSLLMTSAGEGSAMGGILETNMMLSLALLFMILYIAARFRRKE